MTEQLTALTVARFLQDQPAFFSEHAELFAALTVPHPNDTRAISLGERQILTLRDRQKDLEQRLAILSHQASFNQSIAQKLNHWCTQLLAVDDPQALPGHIVGGLIESFEVPDVALRLWGLDLPEGPFTEPVNSEAQAFANGMAAPYCGPNKDLSVAQWLKHPPASLAIIPIRRQTQTVGLLLLGSPDSERFAADMGTTFLESIGEMACAALSRLPLAQ
jgi:uncharacterized protein YigA (DUF484 family)